MKNRKRLLWLFIGASTYLILMATTDYSKLGLCLAIGILIYLGLLKMFPDAARVWLALGGAFGGAMIVGSLWFSMISPFRDGWNLFGFAIWSGLLMIVIGGVLGFWVTGLLTEPPKGDTSLGDEKP